MSLSFKGGTLNYIKSNINYLKILLIKSKAILKYQQTYFVKSKLNVDFRDLVK